MIKAATQEPGTELWTGAPHPLGATWDGQGVNFAIYSRHADKVELCLYDDSGKRETQRIPLRERTDFVWHGYVPQPRPGQLYGYRVYGPYKPEEGHRFNPNKLLLDPYARGVVGNVKWSDAHYGYTIGNKREDLCLDKRDDAPVMPKSQVIDNAFDWSGERRPRYSCNDRLIYEVHVGGYTHRHPDVPPAHQGKYLGLATRQVIEHMQSLGVTTAELLPVHAFVDDRALMQRGLVNYWGYNTVGFFAPEARYGVANPVQEFKTMVKTLHAAGIEVILDVVFNHTGEGNEKGPTLSFRGIDNHDYYRLAGDRRFTSDFTGTGNSLDLRNPRVLQLVVDSLRYWATEMHVDGFRFDLASTLGRDSPQFDPQGSFFHVLRQDPVLSPLLLVAEPWDLGDGGYQVGSFPPGWAEWNDQYRDTMRAYWKGDGGLIGDFARRLTGSHDLFGKNERGPCASVNFITAHDGFTLHDLVSYNEKHNEEPRRQLQQPRLELRRRGPHRRCRDQPAARAAEAQLRGDAAAVAGRADDGGRRRGRPHAAGKQQRLLPGQRDQLGRLVLGRSALDLPQLREAHGAAAEGPPDLPAARLLPRRAGGRQGPQGRRVVRARRPRDDHRGVGEGICSQPGHVALRRCAARDRRARLSAPGFQLPRALQRAPRRDRLQAAGAGRGRRLGRRDRHVFRKRRGARREPISHRVVPAQGPLARRPA
jgi:hypothetical protein